MKTKKILLLSFFIVSKLFAQTPLRYADLKTQKPSWQAVIGGQAIAPVVETSYGFAVVSDGRLVSTCTSHGNVMWQKGIRGKPSGCISAWGDFIYVGSEKSKLNFMNPSGVVLWSQDCGFELKNQPFSGWDGRIFVQGEEKIACYGINGRRKWILSVPPSAKSSMCSLSDGSLLVFLNATKDNKSIGIRISPFGKMIESITFAGKIICAKTVGEGVIMSFSDGSTGLCAVDQNGSAISKWVQKGKSNSLVKQICPGTSCSALFVEDKKNAKINIISNKDGSLIKSFSEFSLNISDTQFLRETDSGFFISDSNRAIEFTEDGTILWEATLPAKKTWSYITYTNNNQILLCMNNWILNAFVMNQTVTNKNSAKEKNPLYIKASNLNQTVDGITYTSTPLARIEEIKNSFLKGDTGPTESQMLSELKEQIQSYNAELSRKAGNSRDKNIFYSINPLYTKTVLEAASQSQTDIFADDFAEILIKENDPMMINTLIITCGQMQYDTNGKILESFEYLASEKTSRKDLTQAKLICDSTYSIVQFMGRPALYKRGKNILSHFLYPQYDKAIRDYARETLKNIITLEL